MAEPFAFRLTATDGAARTGEMTTPHGVVRTPAFMPVGTQAAIKGVHHDDVRAAGADIMLANTYHLMLRPSAERVAALGGLHTFMRWPHPILTDSGGFQVMSLAALRKVEEEGVTFRSHLDGAMIELTPERAVEVQILLGSDIAMQLDECVRLPAERSEIERAMKLSLRWAERCKRAFEKAASGQALFGIVQGGDDQNLREASARALADIGFDGYALGGLAVGETQDVMLKVVGRDRADAAGRQAALSDGRRHAGRYPRGDRPRHRHVRLRHADAQRPPRTWPLRASARSTSRTRTMPSDPRPLDAESRCPAARDFSRAYLHHLFRAGEALGGTLLSIVNLYYYQDLMAGARAAIAAGRFADYLALTREQWAAKGDRQERDHEC